MPKSENPPPGNAEASSSGASAESGLFGHLGESLELVEHAIHEQLASKAEVVRAMGDHISSSIMYACDEGELVHVQIRW